MYRFRLRLQASISHCWIRLTLNRTPFAMRSSFRTYPVNADTHFI